MADPLCKFFDARSLTGSQFLVTYFSVHKPPFSLPVISLHNPPLVRTRRRRKPLHIAFCSTPTSQILDVISTHEHSDGSLLFRFGDPSEVVKEGELEEPQLDSGVEEVESDGEEEFRVVKVFDGANESQVIVRKVGREARGQAVAVATDDGVSESVNTTKEINNVVEVETGLSENLVNDFDDDGVDASVSSVAMQDHSVAEVNIENAGHAEEILEMKDDSEASVSPPENLLPSLEVEEEMKGQSSEESFEDLDGDESPLLGSTAAVLEYSDSVTAQEIEEAKGESSIIEEAEGESSTIEEAEGESSIQSIENGGEKVSNDDSIHLMENGSALTEVQAVDNDSQALQKAEEISDYADPIVEESTENVSADSVHDEINLGNTENVGDKVSPANADTRSLPIDVEDQSTQVLGIDNGGHTELINLSADTDDQASQNGALKDSGGETNEIEVLPLSPKLEVEPILDEEVNLNIISQSNEGESPIPVTPDENFPNLSLEVENSDIMEVPSEVFDDKSSEVLDSSKEATPAELILSSGATLLQHPSKAFTGGHEAYFVAGGKWLGVADGVGRWSLEGSDPGVYAKELMQNSESIVSQCDEDLINDPKKVLSLSVSKTVSPGSSTALIAHFDGKTLHVANIGDSGFIILRHGNVYRKSSPMLHEFNLPIQIEKGDDPTQLLEEYKIELDEGDVIITATDALFDNLYEQEIVSIVSKSLEANITPQDIAEVLATTVLEVGSFTSGRSPFADAAQAAGYVGYTGGKRDDVAIIVSIVRKV